MSSKEKIIAVIGAGIIGTGLIRNLQKSGYRLHLYNRNYSKTLALATPRDSVFQTPGEAVKGVKYVISCVTDDNASEEVWFAQDGAAAYIDPGCYCMEMSTLSHAFITRWAQGISYYGGIPLDCPITGSKSGADNATLTIFIGGNPEDIESVTPLLKCLGSEIIRIGNTGEACKFKLVYNLLSGTMLVAYAEALGIAKLVGLDLKLTGGVLSTNGWSKLIGSSKGYQMIIDSHEDVHCSLANLAKDLHYANKMVEGYNQQHTLSHHAVQILARAHQLGWGDLDMSVIGRMYL